MNVLIVDDNPMNLKVLRAILEADGHNVISTADGVEALEQLEQTFVDVIISDILMPNMDGFRLCQEVRKSELFHNVPFVIYTATYTSPGDEKLAQELGADKYLRKPAPIEAIREALEEVTRARKAYPRPINSGPDEKLVMKHYSEALVRKLEEKNQELEVATQEIRQINEQLEVRVRLRTLELKQANEELEAFNHSAAHDLRAPLRAIHSYTSLVLEDDIKNLSDDSVAALQRIGGLTQKMASLIDELLKLSHVGRCEISRESVDLSSVVSAILEKFQMMQQDRQVEVLVAPGVEVQGDEPLLHIAMENLLGNSWKFTSKREHPRIEFGKEFIDGHQVVFVRDNGAGFDMSQADGLFVPFKRLHSEREFPGTGLGLNIVQRIVARHGGRIWAESVPEQETTFHLAI